MAIAPEGLCAFLQLPIDNYIRTVVKLEDEFRPIWVDRLLTTACRVVQKAGLTRAEALAIVSLVNSFWERTQQNEKSSSLRACPIVAKVTRSNNVPVMLTSTDFQDICADVLLSRSQLSQSEASSILWELFQEVGSAKKPSAKRKVNQRS